jgi:hypothetical protein
LNARALRRYAPLSAVVALLVAAGIAAAKSTPQIRHVPLVRRSVPAPRVGSGSASPPPSVPAGKAVVQHSVVMPQWLTLLIEFACGAVIVAFIATLVWYVMRESVVARIRGVAVEPGTPAPATRREQVLAAVDAGLSELDDADTDPRRAVIACWVRLEQAAAAAGTPRHTGDTPTELVVRLLDAHQVSSSVLRDLAELYRTARYATKDVSPQMRDHARAALRRLRADLAGSRSGPLADLPTMPGPP